MITTLIKDCIIKVMERNDNTIGMKIAIVLDDDGWGGIMRW